MNNNTNFNGGFDSRSCYLTDEALGLGSSTNTSEARRISSRVHLSLFIYILIINAVMLATSLVLSIIIVATESEALIDLVNDELFSLFLGSVVQYLIGFPILYVIIRAMVKPKYYDKKRLSVGEYFLFLLIGEALMIVGSIVGNIFSEIIGGIFGTANENSVNTVVSELPVWAIFLVVCVLAPIFEELIYRKLIMDRFGKIGGALAVLLSAIAFGLMHCNFYQLFYAVAVGIVFGYVYQRTHNILYTISMHAILNLLGSIVTIPILEASEKVEKMELILNAGGTVERSEYYLNYLLVTVYSLFQLAILAGGVTALVLYIVKKKRLLLWDLGKCPKQAVGASFANVGAILFFSLCAVLSLTNLIF